MEPSLRRRMARWAQSGLAPQAQLPQDSRFPDVFTDLSPDRLVSFEQTPDSIRFQSANGLTLQVFPLQENLFRIRYSLDGEFPDDFSYAVDPGFTPRKPWSVQVEESPEFVRVRTVQLDCRIAKADLKVDFFNALGEPLCLEQRTFQARRTIMKGLVSLSVHKAKPATALFYGLGDKSGPFVLNGKTWENWNTDAYRYGAQTDPLYKAIPFFYGLTDEQAYGIFLDNASRTIFDFSKSDYFSLEAAGGEFNYYFLFGPALDTVAETYALLTGRAELPPIWALGFQQSRWSYTPDSAFHELATQFRNKKIPCDVLYLDIDYMDGFRCFTWNQALFPDLKGMNESLAQQGIRTVAIMDPGIKVDPDYEVYRDGVRKGHFCNRTSGEPLIAPVWPGDCRFPDFTHPGARAWWGKLYQNLYNRQGISGFWNDMNEPAVFNIHHGTFPDAVAHQYDGHPTDHSLAHNVYGMQMARATHEGLSELQPEKRPFVLTRASYAGGQRHAATWTGDNTASWEHLKIALVQCLRLSISGFSFCGSDVGGFVGNPSGELMYRWLQLAIFHPFFRVHSQGGPETDMREPWAFGAAWEADMRAAIEWRYRLLPYLYTAFRQYATEGSPILRPLVFFDQTDEKLYKQDSAFLCGRHLAVYPILQFAQKSKNVYLPRGTWQDLTTGKAFSGARNYTLSIQRQSLPVFVLAGSIIPIYPVRQHTGEPVSHLELHVYGAEGGFSECYEDDGLSYAYRNNRFRLRNLQWKAEDNKAFLYQKREGFYDIPYENIRVVFRGLSFTPKSLEVDGKEIALEGLEAWVPESFGRLEIRG